MSRPTADSRVEDGVEPTEESPLDEAGEERETPCAHTEYREVESANREPADLPATGAGVSGVEARVLDALYAVEDPEMPISVVDLGLIYDVSVDDGVATVEMTLTYTGCPAKEMLTDEIRAAAAGADGVDAADVRLVWSPEWTLEMVTDDGREALREFGVSV